MHPVAMRQFIEARVSHPHNAGETLALPVTYNLLNICVTAVSDLLLVNKTIIPLKSIILLKSIISPEAIVFLTKIIELFIKKIV